MVSSAGMLSLLVVGTILTPIQSYAAPQETTNDGGFLDSPNLKQGIHDEIRADLKNTNQSINQENLCFRSNTCRQSEIGQNTFGNDNQVTGFADLSDNLQQSTIANKTTPTPTPNPTTASLTVIKIVSGNTTATPSDFAIHVSGFNPTPANFNGSGTGTDVTLSPGTFNVTETLSPNFTTAFSSECSGTIATGQHLTCTITNTAKTCEECFRTFLTQAQIDKYLGLQPVDNTIEKVCASLASHTTNSESSFINVLTNPSVGIGVSVTTANELIACLKAAGIVFI
jgi:hypothetical protein